MRLSASLLPVLFLLTACLAGGNYAPIVGAPGPISAPSKTYVVKSGDTLYSLAFAYGLDYRGLAAANKIAPPYRIKPGQTLELRAITPPATAPKAASSTKANARPPSNSKTAPAVAAKPPTGSIAKPSKPAVKASPEPLNQVGTWHWPHRGRVVRSFSLGETSHTGIDISGDVGQPVRATAAGEVVYAGTGLRGYGQMVIIKHNARYLSAYGHNSRLRVSEGQKVKQGTHIADVGSTDTDTPKLHFELRRDGRPVNPLSLLAK